MQPGAVFSYKLRYIVGFWLVEMANYLAQSQKYYVGNITQAIYTIFLTELFEIIYRNVRFFMLASIDQITPRT